MLTPSHHLNKDKDQNQAQSSIVIILIMINSKTTTDKTAITYSSPFPHRVCKKSLPKIKEKVIPIHFCKDNRQYQGETHQLFMMDQWAYLPIKPHKQSEQHRSHTENTQNLYNKSTNQSHFRSTSEVFLKKYLKRKQMKQKREADNITNYAGSSIQKNSHTQSNYLQAIIKLHNSPLQKYRTESHSIEILKQTPIEQPKSYIKHDIGGFRSEKMKLKQKLKHYDTNIKNRRFQIKIADKRYRHILHTFETVNKQ